MTLSSALGNGYAVCIKRHGQTQWSVRVIGPCGHVEPICAATEREARECAERIATDHLARQGLRLTPRFRWINPSSIRPIAPPHAGIITAL